jgi:hypothetical protein
MPSRITSVPLPVEGSSPAARHGRERSTCGPGVRLGSPRVDWWRWCDRGRLRRAAVARSRQHTRCGSVFGEAQGGEDQCTAMGATIGSREELGRVGRRWELAEVWARGGGSNGGRRTAVLMRGRRWGHPFIASARRGGRLVAKGPRRINVRYGAGPRHACARARGRRHGRTYPPRGKPPLRPRRLLGVRARTTHAGVTPRL